MIFCHKQQINAIPILVFLDVHVQLSHLMCAQQILRSAWASAQSDQCLCCVLSG